MISKNQIKLVRSLEQKKHRIDEGLFVAEGPKVVGDLLACHFRPRVVFATENLPLEERGMESLADKIVSVSDDELRRLSFLQHPQQVLALFELPAECYSSDNISTHLFLKGGREGVSGGLSLALDGVQDPGNLGTIIRVADWYGIDRIYCSADTADCWSPKVVQATMGSIARVHVTYTNLETFLSNARVPVYGTVLDGDNIYTRQLAQEGIIVMGNEGNGISQPIRRLLTHRLLIPKMRPGAESLNVAIATAIVCSEFRRQTFSE